MNDYQFAVIAESSWHQTNYYDVTIQHRDTIATGRIVEQLGTYCLISLQFKDLKGLNVIHEFTGGLVGREVEVLGSVVKEYKESLLTATA